MSVKPVILREAADRDVFEAVAQYLEEGAMQAAIRFVDELEEVLGRVGRHPASGSPRYQHELDLPGLRCCPVVGFPYLVFYIDRQDHVDVWRVLHGRRNLPKWLREEDDI